MESQEYHDAHLAFSRTTIIEKAAHGESIYALLHKLQDDARKAERDTIERGVVIDILCAAQGEALREWYESTNPYAAVAVDRAFAVIHDKEG